MTEYQNGKSGMQQAPAYRIKEAGDWGLRNFAHTLYIDPQNGPAYPMFTMTKAGKRVLISPVAGCATPLRDDGGR